MDAFSVFLQGHLEGGLLVAFPLVVLGGLLTALNPCCLPMYPALFGFMGNLCLCKNGNVDEQFVEPGGKLPNPLPLALLFVTGMALATTIMGMLTVSAGWVFGQFDVRLKFLIALLPVFMGLYLLGWLPLKLPVLHSKKLHEFAKQKKLNWVTTLGVGFLFTLVIAPCATPILIVILSFVALSDNFLYGSLLMFIYGIASGLPLLLFVIGYKKIQQLSVSQRWQKRLRQFSGVLLLGVGVYIITSLPFTGS